jgi:hypothetical protein
MVESDVGGTRKAAGIAGTFGGRARSECDDTGGYSTIYCREGGVAEEVYSVLLLLCSFWLRVFQNPEDPER